jgi:hypothetical protein
MLQAEHHAHATHSMDVTGGGRATSLARRLRFCAIAASVNSNCTPLGPRRRNRPSLRMRFRCANSISTFLRSRRDCSNALVFASARATSRAFLGDVARDSPNRRLWTASRLEQTATTVEHAREVKQCRLPLVDQPACRREILARRTDVNVPLLVEREVFPIECPIVALRFVDYWDMRRSLAR